MSEFNGFARELDATLRGYFTALNSAQAKVAKIDAKIEKLKGAKTPQAQIEVARLRIDRQVAQDNFVKVQRENADVIEHFNDIRNRLEQECDKVFCADPSKVDAGTMRLLDSGILTPAEFEVLAERASNDRNYTMLRLIGSAAGKAAETRFKDDHGAAKRLNYVARIGNAHTTDAVLRSFDEIRDAAMVALGNPYSFNADRAVPNPMFFEKWDEIAGGVIEDF